MDHLATVPTCVFGCLAIRIFCVRTYVRGCVASIMFSVGLYIYCTPVASVVDEEKTCMGTVQ